MTTLMQASHQWAHRPNDERFTSLTDMRAHFHNIRNNSRASVLSTRQIEVLPAEDHKGLYLTSDKTGQVVPTNWAFGQLATLAQAPGGYLRTLPSDLAADCINYGLRFKRDIEDVGVLAYRNGGEPELRAATGPRYGRIWNAEILDSLVQRFGDGLTGDFRVPGEFGERVEITKANTTLFAGDRDMFVFLADEDRRIEVPARRDGKAGSLARGFFMWNSEVGARTWGLAGFLFDYVCCNRIVWGATDYQEITIRHTASAPDRFFEEISPALEAYSKGSAQNVTKAIEDARSHRLDNVDEWLTKRFSKRVAMRAQAAHQLEEGRPIETRWDAVTGVTAVARGIEWQDERVDLEREAGKLLKAD